MKKHLLLFTLLASCVTMWAQNNITNGKTVVPLGGLKTYTSEDKQTSYTILKENLQKITVEGNTDNVYLFPENSALNTEANKTLGIQGFYIDLGSSQSISTIQTTWEGAAASYKVYLTDTEPAYDGTLTGETEIANYSSSAQETTKNISVTSDATGRYIVCVPQEATNYGWGVKIRTFVALDKAQAVLGSLTVSPLFAEAGGTQIFTPTALSTTGVAISEGVTYTFDGTASTLENVSVSAGEHTIVATYNGNTATAKVYGISVPDAPENSTIIAALFANNGTASTGTTSFHNYDNGTDADGTKVAIGSSLVISAQNSGKMFIYNNDVVAGLNGTFTNKGDKNYKTLSLDLWSATAQTGNIVLANADKSQAVNIAAGEWTRVQVNIEDYETIGNISVQLNAVGGVYPDYLIANVYMLNTSVEANPFNITAEGVVTGMVTAANVAEINACSSSVINLTDAIISEAISLTPANRNAIVLVRGTARIPNENGANVTASNIVVYDGSYYRAKEGVAITYVDGQGQPQTSFTIDAQTDGYQISRTIGASKYATVYLPATFEIVDGLTVYALDKEKSSKNEVKFTKVETTTAGTPYIVYAENEVTITTGNVKNDLNLTAAPASIDFGSGAAFKGNYATVACDGTQFVIQNGALVRANEGVTIGAFRAYFTGLDTAGGDVKLSFYDVETGVSQIADSKSSDSKYYDMSGRRVQNPQKGIYVVNGKKVAIM